MTKKSDPFDLSAGVPNVEGSLRPAPKFAERISKRVLFVVFGVVGVVLAIFLFALDSMEKKDVKLPPEKESNNYANGGADSLLNIGNASLKIDGSKNEDIGMGNLIAPGQTLHKPADVPVPVVPAATEIPEYQSPPPLTAEQQRVLAEAQARYQRDQQARSTGMSGKPFGAAGGAAGAGGVDLAALMEQVKGMTGGAGAQAGGEGMKPASFGGSGGQGQGPGQGGGGDQDQKMNFLAQNSKENTGYHPHTAVPALSKNEVKTGSFIPMVLEQSINSDLPGQITARVTEDVYDSITGCRMLIPAMSKVVGRYDSKIALGQGRMLIAWNSLIFRDGAELNLAGLQGYDTSGQSGLESDVDNHYWRLFGLTFGLSMITAGVQLSVPQPNPGANGATAPVTPAQTIAASLSQQYGALGSQIISKYMAVQPTLRNYAGERFIVMVPRTIVFNKVWRNRCAGGI